MIKAKAKGVFICSTEQSVYGARTSAFVPPFQVEDIFQIPRADTDKLTEKLSGLIETKSNNYVVSHVGINPASRFVRIFDLDTAARKKNPDYYGDLLKSQFRIDPATHAVSIIEADTGADADVEAGTQTRLMFCGASTEEISTEQQALVDFNIFPKALEISSVSMLGAVVDYTKRFNVDGAILVLEMSKDSSQAFIVREGQIDVTRPIPYGVNSMIPVVKQELGLKDEESARKLFFSNTFDFTEVGPKLLRKLIRELQASTGFYEVQTGQTISQVLLPQIPEILSWVGQVLAESLGVEVLKLNTAGWLEQHEITFDPEVDVDALSEEWFGLISLMCPFKAPISNGEEKAEESA